jgi:hypothetical protein
LWTTPIPLLTEAVQVSPYINVKDRSNVFFAVSSDKLKLAVQSPQTSIWDFQQVALKPPSHLKARRYSSYTTRIQLTDDKKQPLTGQPLLVSSSTTAAVYINNLYYVLTPDPISIGTDELGAITVVEEVESLAGALLYVSDVSGSTRIEINPMDKPFNKIAALNTPEKLQGARITDQNGNESALIGSDIEAGDLKAVAFANKQLAMAYEEINKHPLRASIPLIYQMTSNTAEVEGLGRTIWAEIGDLFNWLASGVKYVVNLIVDAATGVWNFVVDIAGQAYRAVLDGVEKIVGAIQWLYNAIETGIANVIKYLEFIFAWKDIVRTKEVIKNLLLLSVNKQVNQIGELKEKLDSQMKEMQRAINSWAGIDTFKGLGEAAASLPGSQSRPAEGQSAPGDLLSSHFRDNAGEAGIPDNLMMAEVNSEQVNMFFAALKKSGSVVEDFLGKFEDLAAELPGLTMEQILKRVIAIVINAALTGATAVMNVALDMLQSMARAAISLLDTDLYIPVVSEILAFFGVGKITLLDLFCWMAAIPATLGYKIVHNEAPFKDDQFTRFLTTATDMDEVAAAFMRPPVMLRGAGGQEGLPVADGKALSADLNITNSEQNNRLINISKKNRSALYISVHAAGGISLLFYSVVAAFEAAQPTGKNKFALPATVSGVLAAGSTSIAGLLMPRYPIKNEAVNWVSRATSGVAILSSLVFCDPSQKKFAASGSVLKNFSVKDSRATAAFFNALLILPALGCTCWHFYELSKEPAGKKRSAAIIEATGNVTSCAARMFYAIAVNNPAAKPKAIVLMTAANVTTAGLHIAVSALSE